MKNSNFLSLNIIYINIIKNEHYSLCLLITYLYFLFLKQKIEK